VDLSFRSAHSGYPVQDVACQTCHNPHASQEAGLFRSARHPPFVDGQCTDCHALPSSDDPFRIKRSQQQLCGECRAVEVGESLDAAFPHVSAGGGDCVTCHNPHTADGSGLLKKPQQVLCLTCHDPGGSSSGHEGRFVTHGEDFDCSTCHSPHGGDHPILMVDEPMELCASCHSHEHSVAHPMGKESADPRNGQWMDCLSCHGLHDAPYPKYMHRAADRELCVGCHQDKSGGSR